MNTCMGLAAVGMVIEAGLSWILALASIAILML
jgi:hypothetical protein